MMQFSSWKIAGAQVIGKGHIQKNLPCQDKVSKLKVSHASGVFYGLALADGAGSCPHSDQGAEYITSEILIFLKSNFLKLFKRKKSNLIITEHIEYLLGRYAKKHNINVGDLSSTLLFIAIKYDRFLIGHIGDGVIGVLNTDGKIKTISKPENGEFSNSTFFTTTVKATERLRLYRGTLKKSIGFICMSDGAQESLYEKEEEALSPINVSIIEWLRDNDEESVEKALYKNLKDVISQNTYDDCSIGILRRKEV